MERITLWRKALRAVAVAAAVAIPLAGASVASAATAAPAHAVAHTAPAGGLVLENPALKSELITSGQQPPGKPDTLLANPKNGPLVNYYAFVSYSGSGNLITGHGHNNKLTTGDGSGQTLWTFSANNACGGCYYMLDYNDQSLCVDDTVSAPATWFSEESCTSPYSEAMEETGSNPSTYLDFPVASLSGDGEPGCMRDEGLNVNMNVGPCTPYGDQLFERIT